MGRKYLTSVALVAAAFGCTAGPAIAKTEGPSLSNGAKPSAAFAVKLSTEMRAIEAANPNAGTGDAVVINHGKLAECTAASPTAANGKYTNFFTKDTTNYVEFGGFLLVGDCSADLTKKQTGATSTDQPSGKKMIPYSGYHVYTEECNIAYKGTDYFGDAESITYADGEFTETCIAPIGL